MVLMIDNYDSYTYNLVQYFKILGEDVQVFRNDEISPEAAQEIDFDYLVISPGPSNPLNAGCSMAMIKFFAGNKPILGVCLGHQSIGAVFGANIINAKEIMHGKVSLINHDGKSVFSGLPNPFRAVRYHSLVVERETLSDEFEITAETADGDIMAIRHKTMRIEGVQFHPESVGTEDGIKILSNFIKGVKELPSIKNILRKSASGKNLTFDEAFHAMNTLAEGGLSPAVAGSFLTSLSMKGETVDEISGFVKAMRGKAVKLNLPDNIAATDTCGTGGDESGTFNISTAAAFVSAGAGCYVAKHGNRSITSKCGSADVLEALGIKIQLPPEKSLDCLLKTNMTFLFAPNYHPAFKNIAPIRKELGFKTVFNIMGPMLNPAFVKSQIVGVFDASMTEKIAAVLFSAGVKRAMVVNGGGIDEISLFSKTKVSELNDGWIKTYEINPEDYGFDLCSPVDIKGGTVEDNAAIIKRILSGEKGPHRDIVVLNSAASIYISGNAESLADGVEKAARSIDSGNAAQVLKTLIKESNS